MKLIRNIIILFLAIGMVLGTTLPVAAANNQPAATPKAVIVRGLVKARARAQPATHTPPENRASHLRDLPKHPRARSTRHSDAQRQPLQHYWPAV